MPSKPESVSRKPESVSRKQESVFGKQESVSRKPESVSGKSESVSKKLVSVSRKPECVSWKQESVSGKLSASSGSRTLARGVAAGNNLNGYEDSRTENRPSQGENLALTGQFVPNLLDSGWGGRFCVMAL